MVIHEHLCSNTVPPSRPVAVSTKFCQSIFVRVPRSIEGVLELESTGVRTPRSSRELHCSAVPARTEEILGARRRQNEDD